VVFKLFLQHVELGLEQQYLLFVAIKGVLLEGVDKGDYFLVYGVDVLGDFLMEEVVGRGWRRRRKWRGLGWVHLSEVFLFFYLSLGFWNTDKIN
jgi:hypothetical protein